MKIDIFNHFLPERYLEAVRSAIGEQPIVRYASGIRPLWNVAERLAALERWPDVRQIVTLGQPTPEMVAAPDDSPELARLANDGMAAIRDARPDRFPAFVASLPMNNVPAAIAELDRAVGRLGARGVQILTSINGRPLDDPEFFPLFERIVRHHALPIWLHPFKAPTVPDYPAEAASDYEIWLVLNWPHESSVAMARLVFSGMFDRLPGLRVITHHCGATIPYLAGRVGPLWDEIGARGDNPRFQAIRRSMAEHGLRPIDYFKRFYGDTVLGGSTAALRCGLDFFGPGHVVFGTDFPYGPERGDYFLRETIRSVDEVDLPQLDREGIYCGNALKLMGLRDPRAAG